ncbi:MAG: hypothetical protein ACOYVD_13755 [Bacillota bacterium]
MCGIFGFVAQNSPPVDLPALASLIKNLFSLSESRGKEAAGIAALIKNNIEVLKMPVSASKLTLTDEYASFLEKLYMQYDITKSTGESFSVIAHSRLTTNGDQDINDNNQPVVRNGIVGIHNGIIVNDDLIWKKYSHLKRFFEVDTEALLAVLDFYLGETNSIKDAVARTYSIIEGSASIAVLLKEQKKLLLATNTGSLYIAKSKDRKTIVFASEKYILAKISGSNKHKKILGELEIHQLKPSTCCIIDLETSELSEFVFNVNTEDDIKMKMHNNSTTQRDFSFNYSSDYADSLRRCSKCILPETFPFIEFDEHGVCNYCKQHASIEVKGKTQLENLIYPYRSKNGEPDCLVGFSGGRDSSYGLYYIKKILGMNPIAFTYDWGMVTDLARRNQARICGKLGIEHIIVSADITQKRRYIGKNINAWIKKPDLGMIPLFMAGDKQFYYYANKLKKQTNIKLFFFCAGNELEKTDFKTGFCGIKTGSSKGILTNMPFGSKLELIKYYLWQYFRNPAYFNESLLDTFTAYLSSYAIPHDYIYLYHYIKWDEKEIMKTLAKEFDWEAASDTKVTWRIGDGTASFYNYIYYTVAGFTENDTFRSNQIREGMITREEALTIVREENKPRFTDIEKYCNLVGVDFARTIDSINKIPKIKKLNFIKGV